MAHFFYVFSTLEAELKRYQFYPINQERQCRGDTELAFKARHKQLELVTEN